MAPRLAARRAEGLTRLDRRRLRLVLAASGCLAAPGTTLGGNGHGLRLHAGGARGSRHAGAQHPRRLPGRREPHPARTSADPERETLVYLRTALDPSPVVTRAGEFLGLLEAARIWLRQNGVGPGDVVAILAPNVHRDGGRLLGGDELCRRPAAQSPVQPRGDRRPAQARSRPRWSFTPPPGAPGGLYEKVEGLGALAPSLERIVVLPMDGRVAFGDEHDRPRRAERRARDGAARRRSPRCSRPAGRPASPRSCRSPIATSSPRRSPRCSRSDVRPDDRVVIALPLFHVGGAFCTSLAGFRRRRDDDPADRGRVPQP